MQNDRVNEMHLKAVISTERGSDRLERILCHLWSVSCRQQKYAGSVAQMSFTQTAGPLWFVQSCDIGKPLSSA
eukprot:345975-Amphidinium_carterae.1